MTASDTVARLLAERYAGVDPGDLADLTGEASVVVPLLMRHQSIRRFAPTEVDDRVVRTLVAAAQSASSSSHNQPWSALVVRDRERIRSFAEKARISAFAAEAPLLLLFAVDWARGSELAARHGESAEAVEYLESTLVGFVDCGIAAQNAVIAAESLGLGACYLGSFRNDPAFAADALDLPQGSMIAFGLALGYPGSTETKPVKPRLPQSVVVHKERYTSANPEEVAAFASHMDEFYAAQGRSTSWLRDTIARVRSIAGLHGRDTMRRSLERRGLPSR